MLKFNAYVAIKISNLESIFGITYLKYYVNLKDANSLCFLSYVVKCTI